jgi:hypothetical protein
MVPGSTTCVGIGLMIRQPLWADPKPAHLLTDLNSGRMLRQIGRDTGRMPRPQGGWSARISSSE